jgi:hypothetical protein
VSKDDIKAAVSARVRDRIAELNADAAAMEEALAEAASSCWCCGQHGISCPADEGTDGLCAACRGRSPSACRAAHEGEAQ